MAYGSRETEPNQPTFKELKEQMDTHYNENFDLDGFTQEQIRQVLEQAEAAGEDMNNYAYIKEYQIETPAQDIDTSGSQNAKIFKLTEVHKHTFNTSLPKIQKAILNNTAENIPTIELENLANSAEALNQQLPPEVQRYVEIRIAQDNEKIEADKQRLEELWATQAKNITDMYLAGEQINPNALKQLKNKIQELGKQPSDYGPVIAELLQEKVHNKKEEISVADLLEQIAQGDISIGDLHPIDAKKILERCDTSPILKNSFSEEQLEHLTILSGNAIIRNFSDLKLEEAMRPKPRKPGFLSKLFGKK